MFNNFLAGFKRLLFVVFFGMSLPHVAMSEGVIIVEIGKAAVVPKLHGIQTIFVADNSIADASVADENQVFIFGKNVGETTLYASSMNGAYRDAYTVVVTHNISQIERTLSVRFPQSSISVNAAKGSILVKGVAPHEGERQAIIKTISAGVPETAIIDNVLVQTSNLVRLRVRLLEVNRTQADEFGINWDATVASNGFFLGASKNGVIRFGKRNNAVNELNASLDLLTSAGIVSVVQETLLSTVNGRDAEFSVGNEIPVPNFVSDNSERVDGNYKLDYKFIGTKLNFLPSAAPGGKLRLDIHSTVSSSESTGTEVNGDTFPNLSSRSIRTSVELRDQQSFVIAGISRSDTQLKLRNPRKGGLSKFVNTIAGTDKQTKSNQELVVVVTPLLSESDEVPVSEQLPRRMTNLEYILTGGTTGLSKGPIFLPSSILAAGFQY